MLYSCLSVLLFCVCHMSSLLDVFASAAMHNDNSSSKKQLSVLADRLNEMTSTANTSNTNSRQNGNYDNIDVDNPIRPSTVVTPNLINRTANVDVSLLSSRQSRYMSVDSISKPSTSGQPWQSLSTNGSLHPKTEPLVAEPRNEIVVDHPPAVLKDDLSNEHHQQMKSDLTSVVDKNRDIHINHNNEQLLILNLNHSKIDPEQLPSYKLETNEIDDDPAPPPVSLKMLHSVETVEVNSHSHNDIHNFHDFISEQDYLDVQEFYASTPSASVESAEQREMEMKVAELDAQMQWYVPVSVSGMFDEPAVIIEGSGESAPTVRIHDYDSNASTDSAETSTGTSVDDSFVEGSGHTIKPTTRRTPIHDSAFDFDEDAIMVKPVAILKPTRPERCLGNRHNLTDQEQAEIREDIRQINKLIQYYISRLMHFCMKQLEYNRLYFKCSLWMDRKQMYYTNYMRLKYCNPVGWPVFL